MKSNIVVDKVREAELEKKIAAWGSAYICLH